ncbi:MAG: hypothetical protein ACXV2E_07270 [Halobacteriota archaeon]
MAVYSMPWAATIANMFFLRVGEPLILFPAGIVVFLAPMGVRLLLWIPVFM